MASQELVLGLGVSSCWEMLGTPREASGTGALAASSQGKGAEALL